MNSHHIDVQQFKQKQVREDLARSIYYGVSMYHGTDWPAWESTPLKEHFRDLAHAVLNLEQPDAQPVDYFKLAVEISRGHFTPGGEAA
jgi:hypothetical protein